MERGEDILDKIIVGRVEPHIYAFTTNTVPNYLKVGDTYRPVNIRLDEWKDYFPNLVHEVNWEWLAKTENGKYFRDFAVHYYLEVIRGFHRLQKTDIANLPYYSREFFEQAKPEDVDKAILDIEAYAKQIDESRTYQFYSEERLPEETHYARIETYEPRPNQERTIKNFIEAREAGRKHLLMYAVMRFGKSFTSMCCAKEMDAKIVLVVSAKADVRNEWKKTVESHVYFEKYEFLDSKSLHGSPHAIQDRLDNDKRVVIFLTLQDLMGDDIKEKHQELFKNNIDLLIVDETHFGARAEEYGRILRNAKQLTEAQAKKELEKSEDSTFDDLEEGLSKIKELNVDTSLHLSGTPYRILMGSEFKPEDIIAFYQFSDIIDDKEQYDHDHINEDDYKEWSNPYYGFPQMVRFAFNPNESSRRLIEELKKEGKSAQLNELFRPQSITKDTANFRHKYFVHEKEVKELLSVIDGSAEDDNLLGFLNYEKLKEGKMCRHMVFVLPFCASCDAMEQLLKDHQDEYINLNEYEIVNISGLENTYSTTDTIKAKISSIEQENKKSISLTVNRMLTGSTVKEWDTMLFLKDVSSPQEYDQAIFRLQNQYVKNYKEEGGDTIKYNMKPQTLLVDFDPDRMFFMQEQKSMIYNVNTNERGNDELEERLGREIEISPIIVVNKGKITEVTPTDIIDAVRNYSANKTVMEEATTVPTDNEILNDPTLWDYIKDMEPIDNKNGLNIKPYSGEGDEYTEPEDDSDDNNPYDNLPGEEITSSQPMDTAFVEDEMRDKRLASFFARILFFALLTKDKVKTLQQIIDAIKRSDDNKRIAQNVGLSFKKLWYIHKHINPFILSNLDYKINNINDLLSDETFTPVERVERALLKFGRLSNSEVVTPSNVADEMVALLPKDKFNKNSKFLDIASKQGEFACALYKQFGEKIKNNIYAVPTSNLTYEFTRKVFELLGIPVKNIFSEFNSYDLIGESKETYIKILLEMKFDAIVGNPPYQMSDGGGMQTGSSSGSSMPLYQKFVLQSKNLNPIYISMIIPSRWFSGGRGLDDFRDEMLSDRRVVKMVDYSDSRDFFPRVDIAGGVCYLLWCRNHNGQCIVINKERNKSYQSDRYLDEFPVFVRHAIAVNIIKKVLSRGEQMMNSVVYSSKPFGFRSFEKGRKHKKSLDVELLGSGGITYVARNEVTTNADLIDRYKVIMSKSSAEHAGQTDNLGRKRIVSRIEVLAPNQICSETYLLLSTFESIEEAQNLAVYVKTRFFRFLLSTILLTQNIAKDKYMFVPLQDFSKSWTDAELYAKYDLTDEEIQFIESMIKPME